MTTPKKKWWISWYNCWDTMGPFTLYTPWWESGLTMEEPERQTMVAALWAGNEDEIREIIYGCYDKRPEHGEIEFRFMEQQSDDWDPRDSKSGRFVVGDWAVPYWERGEYRQEK